MTLIKGATRGG